MSLEVREIETTPFSNQNPGTSGLRKKTKEFMKQHYLENFVQCVFDTCDKETITGGTLLVSGDGRFHNRVAIQTIAQIAIGNGVKRVWIGQNGLCSTPAASAIVRERENGVAFGGFILTASHNPGGESNDFGIKFNVSDGSPALETFTSEVFSKSKCITKYKMCDLPKINIDEITTMTLNNGATIEVIDPIEDWLKIMKKTFDFDMIKTLLQRKDFKFTYDGMHGVAGPSAIRVLVEELGLNHDNLTRSEPKEDFGGCHPDPNLTYAPELVKTMHVFTPNEITDQTPDFGAATDGDGDRNMVLGKGFFVTPSDSVAIIAHYAKETIPYFKQGLKGLSRSMPTSRAVDGVAKAQGIKLYEVPTGWKFFCNLMNAGELSICGEESFGTGSDHIREKDGLWAVLAWLSVLAHKNANSTQLVSVKEIVEDFWRSYGRHFYTRYDYEEVESERGAELFAKLQNLTGELDELNKTAENKIIMADNFTYKDPIDQSVSKNQGYRFHFGDGSRVIFRLSGTGSVGATIRMYIEQYTNDPKLIYSDPKIVLDTLVTRALAMSNLVKIIGRDKPTVIT